MNTLESHFGGPDGGTHFGCFFHLKQAWYKHLRDKLGMVQSSSVGAAMATGGLDLLCVLPQEEVVPCGIPFLRWTLEVGIPASDKLIWTEFWEKYFPRQWIPIIPSWNVETR